MDMHKWIVYGYAYMDFSDEYYIKKKTLTALIFYFN